MNAPLDPEVAQALSRMIHRDAMIALRSERRHRLVKRLLLAALIVAFALAPAWQAVQP